MENAESEYVYIMTNPCLDGWIKIGRTKNIDSRINDLNSPSNIPLSFRCYASYKTNDAQKVEKFIHNIIDLINDTLHARELLESGKVREREFFKMSPEIAYGIFKEVAGLRNEENNLTLRPPTREQANEEQLNTRALRTTFEMLHIDIGTTIYFVFDENITATVVDKENKIECNGERGSVTWIAKNILVKDFGWANNTKVNGWSYFRKDDGIATLYDKRKQILNSNE